MPPTPGATPGQVKDGAAALRAVSARLPQKVILDDVPTRPFQAASPVAQEGPQEPPGGISVTSQGDWVTVTCRVPLTAFWKFMMEVNRGES